MLSFLVIFSQTSIFDVFVYIVCISSAKLKIQHVLTVDIVFISEKTNFSADNVGYSEKFNASIL